MKPARYSIAVIGVAAGVGFAIASLSGSGLRPRAKKPEAPKPSAITMAVDTLEHQLQRRFHDRNNVTFGYERAIRFGARMHETTVLDVMRNSLLQDDGVHEAKRRQVGGDVQFEMAPGQWISSRSYKESMHAENDQEKQAIAALSHTEVAIYTAGMFDTAGRPQRLKGPAYLRQLTPIAPARASIEDVAVEGWRSSGDTGEVKKNGWLYRVVKVKADDQSCVKCHTQQAGPPRQNLMQPYKLNEPIGVFVIGTKEK